MQNRIRVQGGQQLHVVIPFGELNSSMISLLHSYYS